MELKRFCVVFILTTFICQIVLANPRFSCVGEIEHKKILLATDGYVIMTKPNVSIIDMITDLEILDLKKGTTIKIDDKNDLINDLKSMKYSDVINSIRSLSGYIFIKSGGLSCYTLPSGKMLWQNQDISEFTIPKVIYQGYAYAGLEYSVYSKLTHNTPMIAIIDMQTGYTVFRESILLETSNNISSYITPLIIDNCDMYFADNDYLYKYDFIHQKIQWRISFTTYYGKYVDLKLYNNVLYGIRTNDVSGSTIDNTYAFAIDTFTGMDLWSMRACNIVIDNGFAYVLVDGDGGFVAKLDRINGKIINKTPLKCYCKSLSFDKSKIYNRGDSLLVYYQSPSGSEINLAMFNCKDVGLIDKFSMQNIVVNYADFWDNRVLFEIIDLVTLRHYLALYDVSF